MKHCTSDDLPDELYEQYFDLIEHFVQSFETAWNTYPKELVPSAFAGAINKLFPDDHNLNTLIELLKQNHEANKPKC